MNIEEYMYEVTKLVRAGGELGLFEWRDKIWTYLQLQERKENIHEEWLEWCDLYINCGGAKGKLLGVCVMENKNLDGNVRGCGYTYR